MLYNCKVVVTCQNKEHQWKILLYNLDSPPPAIDGYFWDIFIHVLAGRQVTIIPQHLRSDCVSMDKSQTSNLADFKVGCCPLYLAVDNSSISNSQSQRFAICNHINFQSAIGIMGHEKFIVTCGIILLSSLRSIWYIDQQLTKCRPLTL